MKNLADFGYAIIPGFIELPLVRELVAESRDSRAEGDFVPAAIGMGDQKQVVAQIRTDEIRWLEPQNLSGPQSRYWDQMEVLRVTLNRTLFLGLFELEAHLACFPPGGFYKAHLDCHQNSNARILSTIIYLDEGWATADGGQLRLYIDRETGINGASIDIFPEPGKLVVFLSPVFWHEVRVSTRHRHSMTGWFRRRPE
ncbi:MAG: 2OG-Fe(II) oxygenase [Verrucomicrobiae bacterium]|nr:2OG-Fe(II) oxygenase [Verrucomicrobiae bacterium]